MGVGNELWRGTPLGALSEAGALDFAVLLDGRSLDHRRYLLATAERRTSG